MRTNLDGRLPRVEQVMRDKKIVQMLTAGKSYAHVCKHFGFAISNLDRILRRIRKDLGVETNYKLIWGADNAKKDHTPRLPADTKSPSTHGCIQVRGGAYRGW